MAYNLIDLSYSRNPQDCCYFFDSNILLPILGLPAKDADRPYLEFFKKVFLNCTTKEQYKIYTCTNQLSEVFNVLMKWEMDKIYTPEQKERHPHVKKFFKDVFRPSTDYARKFELYKDGFLAYKDAFKLVDLGGDTGLEEFLEFNVKQLDFNDMVILRCVSKTKSVFVSNDGDFYGHNITQITLNKALVKKFKERPIPVVAVATASTDEKIL